MPWRDRGPDLPPKYDSTGVTRQSDDETNDPLIADNRNFYKVEKWTKDGAKVDHMLYAGEQMANRELVHDNFFAHVCGGTFDVAMGDAGVGAVTGVGALAADGPNPSPTR